MTDLWGRKFCFMLGLIVYGAGAIIAAAAPLLGVLVVGYSLLEGIGSALMIPPIYIIITIAFRDLPTRAKYFGVISGAAGLGAALGLRQLVTKSRERLLPSVEEDDPHR